MKRVISLLNKVSSVILRLKPKDPAKRYGFLASLRMMKKNRQLISLGILGIILGSALVYFYLLHGNGAAAAW